MEVVAMDFKSSTVTFDTKSKFTSDMKRFACDEAARFTADSNEAASASIDDVAEKGIRFLKQQEAKRIYNLCASKLQKDGYTPDSIENAIDLLRSIEKKTQAKYDSLGFSG